MGKLTKQETSIQKTVMDLVNSDKMLTDDEKLFILTNYNPRANHNVTADAVYFTPRSYAHDMMIETLDRWEKRVLDLGAGIGMLAYHALLKAKSFGKHNVEIVCVEKNPEFCRIGQRVLPEAEWICGDMFDRRLIESLGRFDEVLSNPPYGLFPKNKWLKAKQSQYAAAEVAMSVAPYGVFLLAQSDCPFKLTGQYSFQSVCLDKYDRFHKETGIEINHNCGIDLEGYETYKDWPEMPFEIVSIEMSEDFEQPKFKAAQPQVQLDLFDMREAA